MNRLDPFADLDSLSLNGAAFKGNPRPRPRKPPRHRPGERFLKGPIPWQWLETTARLPGKALALALHLWQQAGWRRRRTVPVCLSRIGLGVSRYAARRALQALEVAGLVSVDRRTGHGLAVTLLDVGPEE
jgi:hypothetical protein